MILGVLWLTRLGRLIAGLPLSQVAGSQTSVFSGIFTHDYHEGLVRDEDKLPRFMLVGTWNPMASNRISHFFDFRGASMTLETGCSTTLVALHQAMQSLRSREADMSVVTGSNVMLNPDQFKAIGSLGMLSPDGRSYAFDARANGYGRGEGVATVIIKRLSDALAAGDPVRAVIRETALNQDGKTDTITTPSGAAQEELMRECYRRAGLDPRGTQYFEAHGTGTQAGDPIEAQAMANVFGAGEGRDDEANYLRIGSVKSNVGHTEAASGLAAVIKGVLSLENGLIPPSVNYQTPNPKLKLDEWRLKVATELQPWPESLVGGPRRLSVNNFGYGGSNAHVILESAEAWTSTPTLSFKTVNGNGTANGHAHGNGYTNGYTNGHTNGHTLPSSSDNTKLLVLSARDERSCQRMVSDMKAYLQKHRSLGYETAKELLRDLSYTLGERRSLFQWVAAHQVRLEGHDGLDAVIRAFDSPRFKPGRVPSRRPRIGMVFTGQGAQWYAMGRELLTSYPVFRRAIEEAEGHLHSFGAKWSLAEELWRDAKITRVHGTALSIPVCVALQIALVRLLQSWGIKPTAVTSHSSGEIAAAFAVGALTLRQAMATAYHRAVLAAHEAASALGPAKGGMAAVGLGVEEVQPYLDRLTKESGRAVVACINSPQSVTVSGDVGAILELESLCKQDGVFARRLKVQQAYHSHHMNPFAEAYRERLRDEMARGVTQNGKRQLQGEEALDVIFSSAVTGSRITDIKEIRNPNHWVGSLVQPVQFVDAFTDMILGDADGPTGRNIDVVLEVGPHTALGGPIREILSLEEFEGVDLPYLGCLVRDEHAGDTMRSAAINLLREGCPLVMGQINFPIPAYDDESPRVLTDLPTYPWNHTKRHWQESRVNRAIRGRSEPPHDLLGMVVAGGDPDAAVWRRMLRVTETPWMRDHMVQGSVVYPGSGYLCLAIEAISQLEKTGAAGGKEAGKDISGFRLRDVDFLAALVVPDNEDGVEIRTTLRPVPEREIGARGWRRFEVSSVTQESRWTLHARGMIMAERQESTATSSKSEERGPLSAYTRHKDPRDMFANLRARGVYHGPLFQNTTKIVQDGRTRRSVCDIQIRHESSVDTDPVAAAQNTVLHPITLDAIVVSFFSTLPGVGALMEDAKLPRSIENMWVSSHISREAGSTLHCDTSLSYDDAQSGRADVTVADGKTDATVVEIQGLVCVFLGRGSGETARQEAINKGNTTATGDSQKEVCSKVEWGPDLSLRQPLALERIKQQLVSAVPEPDAAIVANLSRVSVYFAHDALQALTPEDVARLEEQPHLAKYYRWLRELVSQAARGDTSVDPECHQWALDDNEERRRHLAAATSQSIEGELICSLGPVLAPILRGEKSAVEIMEKDRLLQRYSADAVRMAPSLRRLSRLLGRITHKNPNARVLEIGAGAGGVATRRILEALGTPARARFASWHVTESSSEALEDARAELADWADLLEFDRLDIEKEPAKQNFVPESYDIVVASQALHAAKNVATAAAHLRSLLKPGGTLLLVETTQTQADTKLAFGLLPSWWQGEEPGRQESPNLTTSSWDRALQAAGLSGVDLEVRDSESDIIHSNSIIMSTVPLTGDQKPDLRQISNPGGFAVVTSNKTPPPPGLVDLLSQRIEVLTGATSAPERLVLEESSLDAYKAKICVFLGEINEPILADLDTVRMEGLRAMTTQCNGLLWVTSGGAINSEMPEQALSQGFLRVLRNEYVGRRYLSLDLDPRVPETWIQDGEGIVSSIAQVLEEGFGHAKDAVTTGPVDFEFAERDGELLIPRIYKDGEYNDMVTGPVAPSWGQIQVNAKDDEGAVEGPAGVVSENMFQEDRPLRLEIGIPGHLDTLIFVDDEAGHPEMPDEMVEISPRAYGVDSQDVTVAMGQVKDRAMGLECAGVVTNVGTEARAEGYTVGDNIMALMPGVSFASRIRVPWYRVVRMPNGMSFEEAASLPLTFTMAWVSLVDTARLVPGRSLLIPKGAGAVGQAAIMLARYLGVTEIYATAESQEMRDHLEHECGIPTEKIFSSSDASFATAVLAATNGRGVDVLLNSLPGPLLQGSLDVVAPLGHIIEIGKGDVEANSLLALASFSRGLSLTCLDLMALLSHRKFDVYHILGKILHLSEQQILKPVQPVAIYPMRNVQTAFRAVQTGVQGKVVLSSGPHEQVWAVPRPKGITPRLELRADASYLVVGGVGGIGRSVAYWLMVHGAKNIILLSRSAGDLDLEKNKSTDGAQFVKELREAGCRVKPVSCDVSLASELVQALRSCEDDGLPPVRGVVQGAMLLRDAVFEQMTLDEWRGGLRPKVDGTWNLHTEFSQPGSLDFFVMLSSVSGVLGIASQTNYAAGGSYEDAMARWRQARGLPGVSIDLGPIGDVGYVAETARVAERLRKSGDYVMLDEETVLRALNAAILRPLGGQPQIIVGLNTGPGAQWDADGGSQLGRDARYSPLRPRIKAASRALDSGDHQDGSGGNSLAAQLGAATSRDDAARLIGSAIAAKLADIFMLDAAELDLTQPPASYGVDSLVAVELRNMLVLQAAADISIFNILQSSSLAALAVDVAAKTRHIDAAT